MSRRVLVLWAVLVMAVVPFGCSGQDPAPAGETETYTVRGFFARAEDDGMTMTVRHEEIPGYMAAMTMPFSVKEASLLEGLEYGDKIQFELVVDAGSSTVTAIEKLPPGTLLSWEAPLP